VVIDPSGYNNFWNNIGVAIFSIAITIASAGALAPLGAALAATISGAIGGFVGGVLSTLAMGGNIGQALLSGYQGAVMGAVMAGFSFYIGSLADGIIKVKDFARELIRASSHAVFNGTTSIAQGGKFIHGFASGFVSSLGGSLTPSDWSAGVRAIAGAALGGTASALGGGSFANGAITGAFVVLFNHVAHEMQEPQGKTTTRKILASADIPSKEQAYGSQDCWLLNAEAIDESFGGNWTKSKMELWFTKGDEFVDVIAWDLYAEKTGRTVHIYPATKDGVINSIPTAMNNDMRVNLTIGRTSFDGHSVTVRSVILETTVRGNTTTQRLLFNVMDPARASGSRTITADQIRNVFLIGRN
jgi:hypothetical protein